MSSSQRAGERMLRCLLAHAALLALCDAFIPISIFPSLSRATLQLPQRDAAAARPSRVANRLSAEIGKMTATSADMEVSTRFTSTLEVKSTFVLAQEEHDEPKTQKPLLLCIPGILPKLESELPVTESMKETFEVEMLSAP
eukprot:187734-Rhodomonas_salina.1